jgi:hypothetical protein
VDVALSRPPLERDQPVSSARRPFAERIILVTLSTLAGERMETALLHAAIVGWRKHAATWSAGGTIKFQESLSRLTTAGPAGDDARCGVRR